MTQPGESYLIRLGPPSKGDTIHRNTCRYAQTSRGKALRWTWADEQGYENIDWTMLAWRGFKFCGVCRPRELHQEAAGVA